MSNDFDAGSGSEPETAVDDGTSAMLDSPLDQPMTVPEGLVLPEFEGAEQQSLIENVVEALKERLGGGGDSSSKGSSDHDEIQADPRGPMTSGTFSPEVGPDERGPAARRSRKRYRCRGRRRRRGRRHVSCAGRGGDRAAEPTRAAEPIGRCLRAGTAPSPGGRGRPEHRHDESGQRRRDDVATAERGAPRPPGDRPDAVEHQQHASRRQHVDHPEHAMTATPGCRHRSATPPTSGTDARAGRADRE